MALVVITGGARSGKSAAAENLAARRHATGVRVVVAVFGHSAGGEDAEYAARIERHRSQRPDVFQTLEYAGGLGWIRSMPADALLLVDCLGTFLGRVMEEEWERLALPDGLIAADAERLPEGFEDACSARLDEAIVALSDRLGDTVVVSNEVGDGVVPTFASGRLFRDLLGRANRRLVERADAAFLAVAGRLLELTELPQQASWPAD